MIILDSHAFRMQMKYLSRLHELGFHFLLSLMVNAIAFGMIALLAYHEVKDPSIRILVVGACLAIAVAAVTRLILLLRRPE